MKKRLAIALAAGSIGLMAAAGAAAVDPELARLLDGNKGGDWSGPGNTFGEDHYSPLTQINDGNVAQLGLVWKIDLPKANSTSEPLKIGNTLYYVTGYSVMHAADALTGKPIWSYDPKVAEHAGPRLGVGWGPRGFAWWKGKLLVGTQDGRLIAIDAKTGKLLWSQQTTDPKQLQYITGAPRVFDGKVVIGFGGADVDLVRGYVTAYDIDSGKQLWRWYAVPGNPAVDKDETTRSVANSWHGEWWKYGGGGTVWNAMAYDPETDSIIMGTGNGTPWNQKVRSPGGGDNLYLCSMVALDAKTGHIKWHYQINPGETWDYNAAMDIEFADLVIDGKPRKVLMHAPKNGFFYVIDRTNGQLISAEKFANKVTWASKIDLKTGYPVEDPEARYPNGDHFELWPSGAGAHSIYTMSYNPKTKLAYLPALERSATMYDIGVKNDEWRKLQPVGTGQTAAAAGYATTTEGGNNSSRLDAWDPVAQKRVWSVPTPGNQSGSTMTTAGNLVFQGQLDGTFNAYAADTGKLLWSFQANAPVMGVPISYSVAGKQFVTVMAGFSAAGSMTGFNHEKFGIDYRTMPRRVLTFGLGGKGQLPPREPTTLIPVDDPDYKADPEQEARGAKVFGGRCTQCHGIEAIAGGAAPDLRTSAFPLQAEGFHQIVKGGALLANGMPRFDVLTDAQVEDIRQYIRSRAAAWRAEKQAGK
jgi:quinohemoprotein ethanol dehydrogenase